MVDLEAQRQELIGEIRLTHAPPPVIAPADADLMVRVPGTHWLDYPPPPPPSEAPEHPDAMADAPVAPPPHVPPLAHVAPPAPAAPLAPATTAPVPAPAAEAALARAAAPPAGSPERAAERKHTGTPGAVSKPAAAVPPPAPPRRRLTVPVLLLIVGVSLVGIAAVFFLILAWTVADIGMKSLIIGGVTLATMVAASLLRRWSLTATAEGIAALGVILLALDGWAARANDLFGSQSMDAVVYAGIVTLAIGILCRVWSVLSRLRGPDLAATLALPVGLGLLAAGLLPLETSAVIAIGLLGTALGGLAHALPAPWSAARPGRDSLPERTALMAIGLAGLAGGAATTLFLGLESMTVQLVAAAAVIVLAVAYAVALRPRAGIEPLPASAPLGQAASALAAGFTASLGWQMAIQDDLAVYTQLVAPLIAVLVAVGLDRRGAGSGALKVPRIAAALVAGPSVVVLVAMSAARASDAIAETWTIWQTPVFSSATASATDTALFSSIAAVVVAVLVFLAPTLARPGIREARPIAAAVVLLAGALGTGIPIAIVGTAVVIAAVSVAALWRGASPAGWGTAAGLGALTAFLAGMASPWLWAVGVLVAVAVPILARAAVRPKGVAGVALALAPVLVGTLAAWVAPLAIAAAAGVEVDARSALALIQWVALVTIVCAVWLRIDAPSRAALAFSSYALFLVSLLVFVMPLASEPSVSATIGEPALAIVRTGALLVVLAVVGLLWTRLGVGASLGAAALVAPAAASVAVAVLTASAVPDDGQWALTTMATAVVVVWIGALLPSRVFAAFGWGGAADSESLIADVDDDSSPVEVLAVDALAVDSRPLDADPLETRPLDDLPLEAGPLQAAALDALALEDRPPRASVPALLRRASDLGALVTAAAALGWHIPDGAQWAMLALAALGFAGAAVTRGWAAPAGERPSGVPETRTAGARLAEAPRRLFAWPAFAAATLALWSWLDRTGSGSHQVEAFVLPPAIGLVAFAAVLVWLRRHAEATIAITLGFGLGLIAPAVYGMWGPSVRGTIVALVASALAVVLAWTPVRRVRMPALAGAGVALLAVAMVAVERALTETAATAWLLLLIAVAFAAAFGFVRGALPSVSPRPAPEAVPIAPEVPAAPAAPAAPAEVVFANLAPPLSLAAATLAVIPSLSEPWVVTVALLLTGALHLVAAALHRLPLAGATRWTAFAAAAVTGGGALLVGDIRAVEVVTFPLAGMLLGGAALAMWRRARTGEPWPGSERVAWLTGVILAVAPSVATDPHDVRAWLVIAGTLLAALGCVVAPIAAARGLGTPSAVLLSAGALAMGLRALLEPSIASGEYAALVAGAGVLVVTAALIWMSETDAAPGASTALAAAGAALLVAFVVVQSEGDAVQASLTATLAGAVGLGGAALLRWRRWAGLGGILAVAGASAALIAAGRRFVAIAATGAPGVEADLWATAGVGIVVAIGIMALRSTESRSVTLVVSATFSIALALFAAAEAVLLGGADGQEVRTILTISALTIVGVLAFVFRERLGLILAVASGLLAGLFALVALTLFDVRPFELATVPPALGMIFLGARALRRDPAVRSWPALGPGLALLTIPSLLYDFTAPSVVDDVGATALWRVVGLGIVAIALVVIGVLRRLQAPLVLGSAVLLVHALAQLWPWISDLYVAVPWWLWLGAGGALLIVIAARYERRMRDLKAAFTAVSSLR
ncbi:MAG TPA: hypothetical protein VFY91_03655 [Microbacterium sp.]|nr:hypothetical protein [Microbacterium sp.]